MEQPYKCFPTGWSEPAAISDAPAASSSKSTQFKVARIGEVYHEVSDSQPALLFDLTSSPMPTSSHLRAIRYFIGDEETFDGDVTVGADRTVVEEIPDGSAMHNILLDSGADASVFPICFAEAGEPSSTTSIKLHDAQGKQIPGACTRTVEIF